MRTHRKIQLAMVAATGLIQPLAASADVGSAQVTRLLTPSENDLAPTTGDPARLKRTDEEQPGAEMSHLTLLGDGIHGIYVEMRSGALNGALPPNKMQLAVLPFKLVQNGDGSVAAAPDGLARFATNNDGNETRNANHPIVYAIDNGAAACAEYNYQANGSGDTKRYMQCFNQAGETVMPQTQIFARNNDDCSMNQDETSTTVVSSDANVTRLVAWRGCNGDGDDDGWLQSFAVAKNADGTYTFQKGFGVSLLAEEERSRGLCTVGTDPNVAVCSYTAGDNQPQEDGTWLAAVNITPGPTGNNEQGTILWKQQIDGRKGEGELKTYSMRAMHTRIMTVAADGTMAPTDDIIWRSGDLHGDNNQNNGKGGTYYGNQMGVLTVTAAGPVFKMPLTNMQDKLRGLDGTHLGMGFAVLGTAPEYKPGLIFTGGSHTGGGYAAKVRTVSYDTVANSFIDEGSVSIAPYDRHLYPNYLGNNPGNQGRNFSGTTLAKNPYLGENGNRDAYLMLFTTTGKDPGEVMRPELKLSSYITVLPLAQTPADDIDGDGEPDGDDTGGDDGSGDDDTSGSSPGGGCSVPGSSNVGGLFILLGMAALIRRRRR